jgi:hypothetical protein
MDYQTLSVVFGAVVVALLVVIALVLYKRPATPPTRLPDPPPPPPTPEELLAKAMEADIRQSFQDLADASAELEKARRAEQANQKRNQAAAIWNRIRPPAPPTTT